MDRHTASIAPCLWLDDRAEEAASLYAGTFPGSRIVGVARYPTGFDNPAGKPRGSVMTVECILAGTSFTLLNGGPGFTIDPSLSFFALCADPDETRRIATALAAGGMYLMPLDAYPWSPVYAWVQDRYGVSWQVMLRDAAWPASTIAPCLMFSGAVHGRAAEALQHYADVFPNGRIDLLDRYEVHEGPVGTLKHGRVALDGQVLVAMDSHLEHHACFSEAVSLQVYCRDQAEVDHFWSRLGDGGEEGPCGWLKDRFGVSWQIVPSSLLDLMLAGETGGPGYERAFRAMLGMTRIDVAALDKAYRDA